MLKKVFLNTGAQITGKVFTASVSTAITLIIFKTLGKSGYGDFVKITVFVGYFYTLADFGLNTIYVKITKDDEINNLKTLLGLRLLIGIFLAAVAVLIGLLLPYNQAQSTGFSPLVKMGIIIASATIVTQAAFTTANAYFQKKLRYELSTIAAIVSYLFIVAAALIVASTTQDLLGYVFAYTLGGIALVIAAYTIISKRLKNIPWPTFKKEEYAAFLKPAWPIGIALLFNLIYFRIDVLILSNFRSSSEVGLYGLAYQFFETSLTVPIFFANAIYPTLSQIYKENAQKFEKQVAVWLKILTGVSLLQTFALIIISLFLPIIFGKESQGASPALQILALGIPLFFVSVLLWHLLIIYNRQKFLTIIYAVGAIFNLIANIIFIPKNGYIAASVITVLSEALIVFLLAFAVVKARKESRVNLINQLT